MVYSANPGKGFRNNALVGVLAWLAAWVLLRPEWVVCILLFAPLVCVPLGLALLIDQKELGQISRIWPALAIAQPFGAAWLVGGFAAPAGMLAGLLTVPWLLVTLSVAFVVVGHFDGSIRWPEAARFKPLALYGRPMHFGGNDFPSYRRGMDAALAPGSKAAGI